MTPTGPRMASICHPTLAVAKTVHDALALAGIHVRLWGPGNRLMRPTGPQSKP